MVAPVGSGEWIEIWNVSRKSVVLNEWWLYDRAGNGGRLTSQTILLPPEGYCVLAPDVQTGIFLQLPMGVPVIVMTPWPRLNDDGDELKLGHQGAGSIDSVSYSEEAARLKGRSWERLRGGITVSNEWGHCADLRGRTAGEPNSLTVPPPERRADIIAHPNPFSPDGDGRDDSLTIEIRLPVPTARLNISIYDIDGRPVRRLASNIYAGSAAPILRWDGRDDSGRRLPIGRYIVHLDALDETLNQRFQTKRVIVLAEKL